MKHPIVETVWLGRALLLAGALGGLIACGSQPEPKTPDQPETSSTATMDSGPAAEADAAGVDDIDNRASVNIDDAIRKACGITENEAFFEFDSARVKPEHQGVLKKLATCFSTGALAGKTMRIVGHTDPRGDNDYNDGLSQRRAGNVKSVIAAAGLEQAQMTVQGLGESEARSSEDCTGDRKACEEAWAADRRVDIKLAAE